jgi:hypothetical protein
MNEWTVFQSHMFFPSVYLADHIYKKTNTYFDDEDQSIMSAWHAGIVLATWDICSEIGDVR